MEQNQTGKHVLQGLIGSVDQATVGIWINSPVTIITNGQITQFSIGEASKQFSEFHICFLGSDDV
ncbi:hypothetical protein D3C86_2117430 [compost metagenome]